MKRGAWEKLFWKIIDKLYEKADPPVHNISQQMEAGKRFEFQDHYLSEEEQTVIVERELRGKKLSRTERYNMDMCLFDKSPITFRKEKK